MVAILLGLISALEAMGFRPIPSDASRPGSLTGTATDQGILGAVLVAVLFVSAVRLIRVRAHDVGSILIYGGLISAFMAVVLSASRIALVCVGIALLFAVTGEAVAIRRRLGSGPPSRRRTVVWAGLVSAGAVGAAALLIPLTRARIFGGEGFAAAGLSDRPLIWREALTLIGQRPFLGWGPSGFEDAVPGVHGPDWYSTMGEGAILDSPHSGYLQLALAGGIPLFVLAIAALGWTTVTIFRRWAAATLLSDRVARNEADLQATAAVSLVVLGAGLATSFTSVTIIAIPAILVGAAISDRQEARGTESRRARRRRRGMAALLACWTAFLAISTSAEIPLAQAEQAAALGDLDSTVSLLDQAASRRPWDVDISIIGAEILAAAADSGVPGSAEEAIKRAEMALARAPESVPAAMALAVAQMAALAAGDQQMLPEAHQTLSDLVERLPNDPKVLHRFAGVLIFEGRLEEAEAYLVQATSIDPDNRNILLTLEYVYEVMGEQDARDDVRARLAEIGDE